MLTNVCRCPRSCCNCVGGEYYECSVGGEKRALLLTSLPGSAHIRVDLERCGRLISVLCSADDGEGHRVPRRCAFTGCSGVCRVYVCGCVCVVALSIGTCHFGAWRSSKTACAIERRGGS